VVIGDAVHMAALAGAATAPRREAAVVMARRAVEGTDPPGAEGVTGHLRVATEAPCAAGGHRPRRATKDLKARMTEGLRPLEHTVLAPMAPAELPRARSLLLATKPTTLAGTSFRGQSRRLLFQESMTVSQGQR
jgi:hypothetical protein